ncbi:MAG TPA: hypothetical protein VLG49_00600 [Rhabdochlamydiaceae bacterium]|nr:hypothetical protein [Rhabdochlamydiaceae bacterium]
MASNYWSCSKFADWIRGTPKPYAGTTKQWNTWERSARKKQFRYWLAEEGLDYAQNFLNWPKNRLNALRCYCDNRWISKTHALTSQLRPGQWHDFETRMMHSAFDSLVDFVEIEQAWHHLVWSDQNKNYRRRWYRIIFHIHQWRNPEAGLEYLNWAAGLRYDDDWVNKNDLDFGKPTHQALAAAETIALYKWWKEVRPKRPDPIDASGWSDYCDKRSKNTQTQDNDVWPDVEDETNEEKARAHEILAICHKLENEQDEEDTEMLIRLVKLRKSLWT